MMLARRLAPVGARLFGGFRGAKPKTRAEQRALIKHRPVLPPAPDIVIDHVAPYNVELPPRPGPDKEKAAFAIVRLGGTQYKVTKGDVIVAEKVRHVDIDEKVLIKEVLLLGTLHETVVGRPTVDDAVVVLHCQEQTKDKKLVVFKKRRRKDSKVRNGHRRAVTLLRVEDIICKQLDLGGVPPADGIPMMTLDEERALLAEYGHDAMRHIKRSPVGTVPNDPRKEFVSRQQRQQLEEEEEQQPEAAAPATDAEVSDATDDPDARDEPTDEVVKPAPEPQK